LELGIVGLPNVGKSTLFNALTENQVAAENYPFCTVDPNVGVVQVPDERLDDIAGWVDSEAVTPASIRFLDVAGLVRDASEGEGLGNQFLSQIRGVDAVCHVLRFFKDNNVSHVEGEVDPLRDLEIIETEFALSDLEVVSRRLDKLEKESRLAGEDVKTEVNLLRKLEEHLAGGERLSADMFPEGSQELLKEISLLTMKPVLYVLNVDEGIFAERRSNPDYRRVTEYIETESGSDYVTICAELEAEMQGMSWEDKQMFLEDLGLEETGLQRLVKKAYELLDLITFFTYNENELRAWSLIEGSTAPQAAGKVHSDFEKGFISAETINYHKFKRYKSWSEAGADGAVRTVGKDYVVRDGDILLFRFNL